MPAATSVPATQMRSVDPLKDSVGHLLSRAYTLPCSAAAQAFSQLVQPTSRFQLALDALLPLLDRNEQLDQRILVSYILYSLYAPHPIFINPFKSVLFNTFVSEREQAVSAANGGGTSENEQLVWVLWKILKGDGNDIGPYSPSTLARAPLPLKLRASNLTLDEESYKLDHYETKLYASPKVNGVPERDVPDQATKSMTTSGTGQVTNEEDERNERIAQAMKLLLASRDRVLTLSEQRHLTPLVSELASTPMVVSLDLPPLVANNPSLAYPLFVALLTAPHARSHSFGISRYLDVLGRLPPTLSTFDLLGRLLREPSPIADDVTGGRTTVADLVRTEVLGWFIQRCIEWLDDAEREEQQGLVSDDRFAKGVANLCRFYHSLIKLGIVDPSSDADTAEMAHFTLRNSRLEEANALYRILVAGKF